MIVAGQQHGGIAQGIAQALWEQYVYDDDGNPLTSTLTDYAMPSAAELPSFEASNTETPSPRNDLGAKGIGESGTIGSTPAVQSAVIDALSHLGVRHIDIPCTAERVWAAVRDAEAGHRDVAVAGAAGDLRQPDCANDPRRRRSRRHLATNFVVGSSRASRLDLARVWPPRDHGRQVARASARRRRVARRAAGRSGGVVARSDEDASATSIAVAGVDLDIAEGEFFSMLGPSGSGKTTMLRMIAGFELPTGGTVLLKGHDVTRLPPFDRDVNTVFQDYALFPHMSVAQNIAYGLRVRRVPKPERNRRVDEALASVRLEEFGARRPHQLSGGQRQRVALARALVNRPAVLLLDEPLGALDLKLREEMQVELKAIQQQVGITFIFVTHDQQEALTMSDRIAVFADGRIEQVGTPTEIYERPMTQFVAGFVGTSNVLAPAAARVLVGRDATCTIRPEHIRIVAAGSEPGPDEMHTTAIVHDVQYLGAFVRVRTETDGRHAPGRRRSERDATGRRRRAGPAVAPFRGARSTCAP